MLNNNKQLMTIDKAPDKALDEVKRERKGKSIDYIAEWVQWVATVSKYLKKHILH